MHPCVCGLMIFWLIEHYIKKKAMNNDQLVAKLVGWASPMQAKAWDSREQL
jgi:hypothetical protein